MGIEVDLRRQGGRFLWDETLAIVQAEPYWQEMIPRGKIGPARGPSRGKPGWTLGTLAAVLLVGHPPDDRPTSPDAWQRRGDELDENRWRTKRQYLDNRLIRGKAEMYWQELQEMGFALRPPNGFEDSEAEPRLIGAIERYLKRCRLGMVAQQHGGTFTNDTEVKTAFDAIFAMFSVVGEMQQEELRRANPDELITEHPLVTGAGIFWNAPYSSEPPEPIEPYPPKGYVGPINWY